MKGIDPTILKKQFAARADARKTDLNGFFQATALFGDPGSVIQSLRILCRDENVMNPNQNGLGVIIFEADGSDAGAAFTQAGTSDINGLGRYLAGRSPVAGFVGGSDVQDGRAEIEILTSKGWRNCVTGEVNGELIVFVDGKGQTTQAGI